MQTAMRLTREHVRLVESQAGKPAAAPMPDVGRPATKDDHEAFARETVAAAPSPDAVWVFAYGSLIWNPEFEFAEQRVATVRGWHRAFCLGWDEWFRGSPDRPGLMLALDRGGQCKGVCFRLPPDQIETNLVALSRRETRIIPNPMSVRWVTARTDGGPVRAITYCIEPKGFGYVGKLSEVTVAEALARAVGPGGSMAEYLFNTVSHLEELDLHDGRLWRLQDMVARRIEENCAETDRSA